MSNLYHESFIARTRRKLVKLEIHFVETDRRCSECHEWKPFPPRYFQYSPWNVYVCMYVYIDNIKEKVSSSKNQDRKQTHVRLNDATRTNYSRWISKKFIFSGEQKKKKKKKRKTITTTTSTIESKYFPFASHFDPSKKKKKSLIDPTRYPSIEARTITFLNRHISQRI